VVWIVAFAGQVRTIFVEKGLKRGEGIGIGKQEGGVGGASSEGRLISSRRQELAGLVKLREGGVVGGMELEGEVTESGRTVKGITSGGPTKLGLS